MLCQNNGADTKIIFFLDSYKLVDNKKMFVKLTES